MAKRSKRTKKTPEELAEEIRLRDEREEAERLAARARDLEAVSLPRDAATLQSASNIEIIRSGEDRATDEEGGTKTVGQDTARRLDAFEALRPSMAKPRFIGAYDAARRLERDMLTRMGMGDRGRSMSRVDCDDGAGREFAQLVAGEAVDAVMRLLPDRDQWLLTELAVPSREYADWREAVAYVTGEEQSNAQGAVVRASCCNLRDAYVRLERKARAA